MNGADQSREEIYALVRAAILEQRPIGAMYHGQLRMLCPHVLGWSKQGRLQMLCYQYSGGSESGLRVEDGSANWRCMALDGLSDVEPRNDPWQTAEFGAHPQTCVERIEVAVRGWPRMNRSKDSAEVAEAGGGPS
jgi:hypothetical protein